MNYPRNAAAGALRCHISQYKIKPGTGQAHFLTDCALATPLPGTFEGVLHALVRLRGGCCPNRRGPDPSYIGLENALDLPLARAPGRSTRGAGQRSGPVPMQSWRRSARSYWRCSAAKRNCCTSCPARTAGPKGVTCPRQAVRRFALPIKGRCNDGRARKHSCSHSSLSRPARR